jgi:hypothetical protein
VLAIHEGLISQYGELDAYIKRTETPLFTSGEDSQNLKKAVEEIYLYPLKETTVIKINRQLKSGITDEQLATMIVSLRNNNSLCIIHPEDVPQEARIICSLGLFSVPYQCASCINPESVEIRDLTG